MPGWAELNLFEGVSLWSTAAVGLVVFLAFFIKGAIGIGSLTPTVLFTALILEPHHAVLLALVVNVVSQAQFIPAALKYGDWSVARQVIVANFAGAAFGIWIFGQVDSGELALILGLVLGGIVIVDLTGAMEWIAARWDVRRPATVRTLSGLAGLISGVTGAAGLLFLVLYLRAVCRDRMTLRGTILLLSAMVVLWRAVVLAATGFIDLRLVVEGGLLAPLVLLGGLAGTALFRRLSEARFATMLRGIVLVGAGGLIWRGVAALT